MEKIKYAAWLRGINVGGNNIIKMDRLKRFFEEMGFSDVKTYIQSGNIIFGDNEKSKQKLRERIENKLAEEIKNKVCIALFTMDEMEEVICMKPENFGEDNQNYKYDVIYLIEPLTAKEAVKEFKPKEGVDEINMGQKVLYVSRLKKELTKSRFSKIIESKIYSKITVRNWNTTIKLYELMKNKI
ncbi:MAG: DUF1697 domain-containing protein [Tannerella sp.]|jgi:uncharacterized protein (DUF1697 family)|nr:DUF1697 domain-containing protein [Tannerella sp.]